MSSSPTRDPQGLATIHDVAHALLDRAALVALAVLAGILLARVLRVRGHHWSWPALGLGRDAHRRPVSIPFAPAAGAHTLVVGATGSGKTVTQTLLAISAIERGAAAIVVDPKGDAGMRAQLFAAAQREGREFFEWTPSGP